MKRETVKMSMFEWRQFLGIMLTDERVRGEIILLSISFEANLDDFLTGYFAYDAKKQEFERIILAKLSMSQKIDVFRSLQFRESLKSFPELIKIFQGMNRLRNHAAHASWGDGDKVYKLADNEFVRQFMTQYPKSGEKTTYRIRRLLRALQRSKDYLQKDYPEVDDIPF